MELARARLDSTRPCRHASPPDWIDLRKGTAKNLASIPFPKMVTCGASPARGRECRAGRPTTVGQARGGLTKNLASIPSPKMANLRGAPARSWAATPQTLTTVLAEASTAPHGEPWAGETGGLKPHHAPPEWARNLPKQGRWWTEVTPCTTEVGTRLARSRVAGGPKSHRAPPKWARDLPKRGRRWTEVTPCTTEVGTRPGTKPGRWWTEVTPCATEVGTRPGTKPGRWCYRSNTTCTASGQEG